jgi:hypothetical protein
MHVSNDNRKDIMFAVCIFAILFHAKLIAYHLAKISVSPTVFLSPKMHINRVECRETQTPRQKI